MTILETVRVGDRYGRLTITNPQPAPELPWHVGVRCECGTTKLVRVYDLGSRINSCGCIRKETAANLHHYRERKT